MTLSFTDARRVYQAIIDTAEANDNLPAPWQVSDVVIDGARWIAAGNGALIETVYGGLDLAKLIALAPSLRLFASTALGVLGRHPETQHATSGGSLGASTFMPVCKRCSPWLGLMRYPCPDAAPWLDAAGELAAQYPSLLGGAS